MRRKLYNSFGYSVLWTARIPGAAGICGRWFCAVVQRGFFRVPTLAIAVLFAALATSGVRACPAGANLPDPRVVMALYDSTQEPDPRDTRLHRFVEFPLNHLGYVLEYVDVATNMPPDVLDARFAGTVSWFDSALSNVGGFAKWAAQVETVCGGDLKQIAFGDVGVTSGNGSSADISAYLARLGLELSDFEQIFGALAEVTYLDPAFVEFETGFTVETGRYPALRKTAEGESLLRVSANIMQDATGLDLLVLGPRGAYAHGSATLNYDDRLGGGFWVLDPFAFFNRVFGRGPSHQPVPVPDVTTLDGRRMFFSTVMSEGWLALKPARSFGEEPQLGSEILRDRLIVPFPDLPATVAVLIGDLDPALGGPLAVTGAMVAKGLFALPQVRIASTGRSLIRDWGYFARYDMQGEAEAVKALRGGPADADTGLVNVAVRSLGGAFSASGQSDTDRLATAPRHYSRDPFNVVSETTGALADAAALAPEGRAPSAFLWTGDARPFETALAVVQDAGIAALGGGGGRYNQFAPSVSLLSPFTAPVGSHLQVYNALSGDETYTNYWTTPIYGFHAFAETLAWTEAPMRLKPFHLAFSARSAVDFGTRRAIETLLDRARIGDFIPVTAAAYVGVVQGFQTVRAHQDSANVWRIQDRGALQTIRFDGAGAISLDVAASSGVLGARRSGDALYIALNPATPEPVISVVQSDRASGIETAMGALALGDSRFTITDLQHKGCTSRITAAGQGDGPMTWFGAPDQAYALHATPAADEAVILLDETVQSAPDGALHFTVPAYESAEFTITVTGQC
ncbi:hypothetical protein [Pseudogemmobacter sp. W21_MBD1_M6]|uniref:hypothetical protein n=1 Tax=Pseudogemmobacter sp. W21_MBD1_M6 TaxID=3240271 RepID=UPI003F97B55D